MKVNRGDLAAALFILIVLVLVFVGIYKEMQFIDQAKAELAEKEQRATRLDLEITAIQIRDLQNERITCMQRLRLIHDQLTMLRMYKPDGWEQDEQRYMQERRQLSQREYEVNEKLRKAEAYEKSLRQDLQDTSTDLPVRPRGVMT